MDRQAVPRWPAGSRPGSGSATAVAHPLAGSVCAATPAGRPIRLRAEARCAVEADERGGDPWRWSGWVFREGSSTRQGPLGRSWQDWSRWDVCSLFPPAGSRFLLTLADAIAVSLDDGYVGVVQQTVQQSGDAGSVWKDLVPFFKGSVRGDDQRLALVSAVDHFVQEVRGLIVEG